MSNQASTPVCATCSTKAGYCKGQKLGCESYTINALECCLQSKNIKKQLQKRSIQHIVSYNCIVYKHTDAKTKSFLLNIGDHNYKIDMKSIWFVGNI